MDEIYPVAPPDPAAPAPHFALAPGPTLGTWLREGLRAAFLLKPRVAGLPRPLHLLAVLLLTIALEVGLARLEVRGPADFSVAGWLAPWWTLAALILLAWTLFWRQHEPPVHERPHGLAGWFTLWLVATLPPVLLAEALAILPAHDAFPPALQASPVFLWASFAVLWGWVIVVPVALARHFGMDKRRLAVLALGVVAIQWVSATYMAWRPWYAKESGEDDTPQLSLSQESFERQQALWKQAVAALAPHRPAVRDVYGLVFAPYAGQDVFLRESTMVADVLEKRFDAQGRVLEMVNNASTTDRLPWATPLNLQRGIEAIASRMDRQRDVLVVYLTSHGASNFKLAATHWPLHVDPVTPAELRHMLDAAGIRNRVIAISACFSGGWIAPLASDTTLVMTAADPTHTSFGCGSRSQLTFFGRAVFDEQLRSTHSFAQAFAAAVPLIRQREVEAHKPDGFSNPQISMGDKIRPVLDELARRLDGPQHL